MPRPTPEELEKMIHRTLRSLPDRRAPRSLEARVLAAIAARQALPWYLKSWSHWPQVVRVAFLILATFVSYGVVTAFRLGFTGVEQSHLVAQTGERLGVLTAFYHVGRWIFDYAAQVVSSIPPLWLYGGGAFVVLMYATFFGLGTVAYSYLYRHN